jgi:hypothetical protein
MREGSLECLSATAGGVSRVCSNTWCRWLNWGGRQRPICDDGAFLHT